MPVSYVNYTSVMITIGILNKVGGVKGPMRKALQVSISIAHSSAVNEVCSYTNVS